MRLALIRTSNGTGSALTAPPDRRPERARVRRGSASSPPRPASLSGSPTRAARARCRRDASTSAREPVAAHRSCIPFRRTMGTFIACPTRAATSRTSSGTKRCRTRACRRSAPRRGAAARRRAERPRRRRRPAARAARRPRARRSAHRHRRERTRARSTRARSFALCLVRRVIHMANTAERGSVMDGGEHPRRRPRWKRHG